MTAYQFMRENRGWYAIREMSKLLGVSSNAYYKWTHAGKTRRRETAYTEVVRLIREIQTRHHSRYGSPQVRKELRNGYGKRVSLKKAVRLMRENGLNARRRRRFIPATSSNHTLSVCENILNRDFCAQKPGQKRVSGITCLRTTGDWVYLTTAIDLFDRKIIGWALSEDMEAAHTAVNALKMAVANRAAQDGLIFHSDRGIQYCARLFQDTLRAYCPAVQQGMSRKGCCWDNAYAETFLKTLKTELETVDGNHSENEVRQSVFSYIEAYYNRVRLHSALDFVAPNVSIPA